MKSRKVAIASDHGGYQLKSLLAAELKDMGHDVLDLGTDKPDVSVDYPDFAHLLAHKLLSGEADCGVAICGSGIGVSMAANRHKGIRAALCHDTLSARLARQHNDANVLALGERLIGTEVAKECLRTFLETDFEGGRHLNRVAKIDQNLD